ncbi:S8 family serine peptidase [Virgibacillus sp. MG-45]|uniref:S8 family serine peptidase n=1 Tax=Virgibacillus sp. MG-45 TaxID=3102791 RepID=UPI003FCDA0A8
MRGGICVRLKKKRQRRAFSIAASVLMTFSLLTPTVSAQSVDKGAATNGKIHQSLFSKNKAEEKVSKRLMDVFKEKNEATFLVKFKEKADVEKVAKAARNSSAKANLSAEKTKHIQRSAVVSELKATSLESQQNVKAFLEEAKKKGTVKDYHSYHIVNGMAVTASKEIAEKIASFAEVEKILPNEKRQLHETIVKDEKAPASELANVEWNVERVGAPQAWEMGIDGSGTVVASLDTGVQWDHPALKEKYRGYDAATGNVEHPFSFYNATNPSSEVPLDDHGHGTHVTGTMVGSEPDGSNQIGVAPGAKWIAVKVFDSAGSTSDAILLDGAEWILAPGGRVDLAPDVVNNSWGGGPGLDEWYRDAVRAWRAAEIFPEFSAGNTTIFNPGGPGSVAVPANYPESFATGATDINDMIAGFSLRGPSPYDEVKPDISAPGVNIRSSVPGGGYEGGWNGTSMSGPAVTAAAALLRQVNASISVDEMEQILMNTATPRTDEEYTESPNNGYGYGILDAYNAVSSIMDGLGTIEGTVTKEGVDNEAPTYSHTAPAESFSGMDLPLTVQVSDNISVASVELSYQAQDGSWKTIAATRKSGDYKSGDYSATIPGNEIAEGSLSYKWVINDFGNNEVTSETYVVSVLAGISTGYFTDFEAEPIGWSSFGENNSWEWGIPTSGPGNAASGEKVFATNLAGNYDSNMNATLVMPPIDLPAGNAYLQFKHWHNLEMYSSGSAYDFGHVFISTDQVEWTQLLRVQGETTSWLNEEVDLSAYAGQRVYIGFNATSDTSVTRDGWYIDDVGLSDTSINQKATLPGNKMLGFSNASNVKTIDKAVDKPAVNADKIQPKQEKEAPALVKDPISPSLLPIGATVNVLESGRSVKTNPADGSYSLIHSAGSYTVQAEAYGFFSDQQTVNVERDGTATANFTLEEKPQATASGKITDAATGEPIEGATILLKEDANVAPVETDADGNYSITAYEGTYTLKVLARGYHGQEVEVVLDQNVDLDLSLEPFYTVPGGEIGYDDGTAENARAYYDAGNAWGVKMSLPEGKDTAVVTDGVFRFWDTEWPVPGGTEFAVEVWDATGADGTPGNKLAGPIDAEALRNGEWTVVDLTEHNIIVDGDFYMVYVQTKANPNVPGLATDENGPNAGRSYQRVGGAWSASPADEGNYMVRARVSYEVETPVITSPAADLVTNEPALTVEGTASHGTTIQLLNNGAEAGTVEVSNDGTFSIPTELSEGNNELKAVSLLDGTPTGESQPVSVTLDTQKPDLTIDNPKDGEKSNRETVTVEGTVSDANLDWVKVNGQKATVTDGKYSKRILLDNGQNEIKVVAQDLAGNKKVKKVTMDVKFNAPVIENLTPVEDVHLNTGESVKIEFDSEPGLRATYVIHMPLTNLGAKLSNATELPMMETSPGHYVGYYTVTADAYADGARIEVKVRDSYKNETRKVADGKLFINLD